MTTNRKISNSFYIASSFVSTAAIVMILWPKSVNVRTNLVILFVVGATAVLSAMVGIFIKTYMKIDSVFLDLLEVCAIPVYMYLSLRLAGFGKCFLCSAIAIAAGLVYTGILIKINVLDQFKSDNKRFCKKVIATGLRNTRTAVLIILVIQMLFISYCRSSHEIQHIETEHYVYAEQIHTDCGNSHAEI